MTFQRVIEQFMKPPFKFFVLPKGFTKGDFYTFSSLRQAKEKAEALVLENGSFYDILNVWFSEDEQRKGWMSSKILTVDRDCEWNSYTDEFTLHTAFFFKEDAVEKWNPNQYRELKEKWQDGAFGDPYCDD